MALQECVYVREKVKGRVLGLGELAAYVNINTPKEYWSTRDELAAVSATGFTWVDRVVDTDGAVVEERRRVWA